MNQAFCIEFQPGGFESRSVLCPPTFPERERMETPAERQGQEVRLDG